jgi:hypothetical protein
VRSQLLRAAVWARAPPSTEQNFVLKRKL